MTLERVSNRGLILAVALFMHPSHALAQTQNGAIGGVVRDAAGVALPGVTVEAASAALIEC
jgi:hypothetical protein